MGKFESANAGFIIVGLLLLGLIAIKFFALQVQVLWLLVQNALDYIGQTLHSSRYE